MLYRNRLVALLDVLGISSKLCSPEKLEEITEAYNMAVTEARKLTDDPTPVDGSPNSPRPAFLYSHFVFDTIILVSHDPDPHGAKDFIFGVSLIMERLFERGMPVRGSIGHGAVYIPPDEGVVLSDQFKLLSKMELAQNWSGCAILPNAEEIVAESILGTSSSDFLANEPIRGCPILPYSVPLKATVDGDISLRMCVNWVYGLEDGLVDEGVNRMAPAPEKQNHTQKFVQFVRGLKDEVVLLSEAQAPATRLHCIKARAGVRLLFRDDAGKAAEPSGSFTISLG
ncbi:hypothetical protein [Thalassospira sp.]|uniref:hypothetical protein n=1 Tax=Thalassospira sp. TaxID=1912094 RepID=UPI001B18992A|nr:hypothetical protein [Thalassospira sp.]MBO6809345.1 hypothetical protein [Thalassospira sp.]MBO6841920.1 hypothetical protein [Thalassospira sp.]